MPRAGPFRSAAGGRLLGVAASDQGSARRTSTSSDDCLHGGHRRCPHLLGGHHVGGAAVAVDGRDRRTALREQDLFSGAEIQRGGGSRGLAQRPSWTGKADEREREGGRERKEGRESGRGREIAEKERRTAGKREREREREDGGAREIRSRVLEGKEGRDGERERGGKASEKKSVVQ